jgi:hypothetical protein
MHLIPRWTSHSVWFSTSTHSCGSSWTCDRTCREWEFAGAVEQENSPHSPELFAWPWLRPNERPYACGTLLALSPIELHSCFLPAGLTLRPLAAAQSQE